MNTIDPKNTPVKAPDKKDEIKNFSSSTRAYWPDTLGIRIRDTNNGYNETVDDILDNYKLSINKQIKVGSEGYIELLPKKDQYMDTFGKNDGSSNFRELRVSIRKEKGELVTGVLNIPNNLLLRKGYKDGIEVPYKKDNMTYYFPGTPLWLYQTGNQTKYGGSYVSEIQISKKNTIGDNKNNFFYVRRKTNDRVDKRILDWVNKNEQESWRKIMRAFYKDGDNYDGGEWRFHKNTNPNVHKNTNLQDEIISQMCNNKKNNWGQSTSKCGGKGLTKFETDDKNGNFEKIR